MLAAARAAGSAIRALASDAEAAERKPDGSLVSVADRAASAIIGPRLRSLDPRLPVICEEAMQDTAGAPRFWLVDPLDGTKEFINRNGEFTVNIALIENGSPVLGVVFAPALDRLFAGAVGLGSFVEDQGVRRNIACRSEPAAGQTVTVATIRPQEEIPV